MSERKKRVAIRRWVARSTTLETLERREVMSADPLGGPMMTTHDLLDEPPALSLHGGFSTAIVEETSPVHDPDADFWFGGFSEEDLFKQIDELEHEIEQTLNEAHDLTGQDEALAKYGFTGTGQTVAVIDTGIAYSHYALGGGLGDGHRVVGGWDFTENDADFYDEGPEGGHGTHVAGIVGADGNTHSGVATGVDLVGLRVFDDAGNGYFSWVEQALDWVHTNRNAFDSPITAVNLSLGTSWNSDSVPSWAMLEDEFAALEAEGIFISVSAGNSYTSYNQNGVSYPAASDHVVPVMSVDNGGGLSYFSQRADYAIAAPGRSIASTVPDYLANDSDTIDDDWANMSGTSMAAPYVAGASVLIREAMEFVGQTGIDQWDIYNHMMSTGDSFFDSASQTTYKRLNIEAALDALMPTDDYGSSVATAHSLGTINDNSSANPLSLVSGVISTLDDGDYFSFTAGSTGTVTFSALDQTHDLDVSWEGFGAAGWTDAGGDAYAMNVVAGQTYTVAVSSVGGLGYYDLQVNLEASFSAIEWGAVSVQETRSGLSVSGEQWYSITTGRTGYFTVEALPQAGSATVAIYDAQQNLLATADGTGRADVISNLGTELLLRVTGETSDLNLRMTNALTVTGGVATLVGTSGDDQLAFTGGANDHSVSLNGVEYTVSVSQFSLQGAGGANTITLQGGSGNDTAVVNNSGTSLSGVDYIAVGSEYSRVNVLGGAGGFDTVSFQDTSGDDEITFRPEENDAYMMAAGVFSYASGFERVNAYATAGGYDRVNFNDTSADDIINFRPEENDAYMNAGGVFSYASGFERVNAYATAGGSDRVYFNDTSSDDQIFFRPEENDAYMSAGGVFSYASGFERVHAYATAGGYDRVSFADTSADDDIFFRPQEDDAYMSAGGVFSYAWGFERVNAYSTYGGYDRVNFYDTTADDNIFFRPEENDAYMSAAGVFSYALGFDRVNAYASYGGYDRVHFYDTSGNDEINLRPDEDDAYMMAGGVFSYAMGFERVNAYSTSGGYDIVNFLGTSGNDNFVTRAAESDAYMSGAGYFHYAHGFDVFNGYGGSGGYDTATLNDTNGDDHLEASGSTASLTSPGISASADGFDSVTANSLNAGSDTSDVNAVDYAFSQIGSW